MFIYFYKFRPGSKHRGGLARPVRCSNTPKYHKHGTLGSLSMVARLDTESMSGVDLLQDEASVLYRFSRPHTILGTTVSVVSITFMATSQLHLSASVPILLNALVPAILMNIAIVGLNQVYDKRIDMINKPYLPMASGELDTNLALLVVSLCTASALSLATAMKSTALTSTLVTSLLLGIFYSVDCRFFRWKRFPALAAACIVIVRALVVHIGFFAHASQKSDVSSIQSMPVIILIMTIYSIVIAIFKDLPDTAGDSVYGIRTASVNLGILQMFWCSVIMLLFAQSCGLLAGYLFSSGSRQILMVV